MRIPLIEQVENLAIGALTGRNSQPTTWDIWKHNARLTAGIFQNSKTKVVDEVIYRKCNFPVKTSR